MDTKFEAGINIAIKIPKSKYEKTVAFYRDILVFKKENKTVGVAKVCFGCSQSIITGTKLNTQEFGQSGDYGRLKKLLYN